jgi:dephospho-CoA kinase
MVGKPIVIGLLGGIASGKSTVARMLGSFGAKVIDADRIAHDVLREAGVAAEIAAAFGGEVLDGDGLPDRERLGRLVFGNAGELARLESIVHPRVREEMRRALAAGGDAPALVLDVPLLLEGEFAGAADVLVFVQSSDAARDRRAAAERGWGEREVERRERSQAPLDEKRKRADHVIENEGTVGELETRVRELWSRLIRER